MTKILLVPDLMMKLIHLFYVFIYHILHQSICLFGPFVQAWWQSHANIIFFLFWINFCLVYTAIDLCYFLSFVYFVDFDLCPNEHAIISHFLRNCPPKSSLDETLDHIAVVAEADKSFHFSVRSGRKLEVHIDVHIMWKQTLPQKISVATDSLFINLILLHIYYLLAVRHFFVKINSILFMRSDNRTTFL